MPTNNNESKRPSLVRCLFGRPDKESTELELKRQEMLVKEDTRRFTMLYGFNPETDKVAPGGQYECVPFSPEEYIPSFYTKVYAQKPCMDNRRSSRGTSRPSAAKRKLNWSDAPDEIVNDENKAILDIAARVPCKGEVVVSVSTARPTDANSTTTTNVLCSSELPFGLTDRPNSDTAEIARREFTTPPNAQLCQRTITDYLPVKKRRYSSQKTSQHTS